MKTKPSRLIPQLNSLDGVEQNASFFTPRWKQKFCPWLPTPAWNTPSSVQKSVNFWFIVFALQSDYCFIAAAYALICLSGLLSVRLVLLEWTQVSGPTSAVLNAAEPKIIYLPFE